MSTRVIRQTRDPLETLERMLNRTTLTTQRVAHGNIIELGGRMLTTRADDSSAEREKAIQQALEAAERRATRELQAALRRLGEQKDEERKVALQKQKEYAERLAQRISDQRDRAEAERMRALTKRLTQEKEQALQEQLEESLRQQERAVREACIALTHKLRQEFDVEKKEAIAKTIEEERIRYEGLLAEALQKCRDDCEDAALQERLRLQKLHEEEIERLEQRHAVLEGFFKRESELRRQIEDDFRELQRDYKRFMDHTDGMFHSDYLMHLRHLGLQVVEKRMHKTTFDDLIRDVSTPPVTPKVTSPRASSAPSPAVRAKRAQSPKKLPQTRHRKCPIHPC